MSGERLTAELMCLSNPGGMLELVKGELVKIPFAGGKEGAVAAAIGSLLARHVKEARLGAVFAPGTGFVLERNPDTVRAPDAAFVSKYRFPPEGIPTGYFEQAPDLAVEVTSPADSPGEVRNRAEEWLGAGTSQVWVLDPSVQTVTVHRRDHDPRPLSGDDLLHGDPLVAGFVCTVRDLFA